MVAATKVRLPGRARPRRVSAAPGLRRYEELLARCGFRHVAGVDEAGRGAAAGPLVVAAVILGPGAPVDLLRDSKQLTPVARERIHEALVASASVLATVVVDVTEIDRLGVHAADLTAMRRAVARLGRRADFALFDGFGPRGVGIPSLSIWKGDRVCATVAAAGIVAKVTRDRLMRACDEAFPGYDFAAHKGYLTPEHGARLDLHGPCAIHRTSFDPVRRAALGAESGAPRAGQSSASLPGRTIFGGGSLVTAGIGSEHAGQ